MHVTLSYSEFQRVGHGYLNGLFSRSCIISPDLGVATWVCQHKRAEHLPIVEFVNLERAKKIIIIN